MKVRHGDVVTWEDNPVAWVASKFTPTFFPPWTYDGILKHGIHRFHRAKDSANARRHIQSLFSRSNLKKTSRIDDVYERFNGYVLWHQANAVITCDSRPRLDLRIGQWTFGGEVGRVDLIASGYRGVLLGSYPQDWGDQLRMPLIQKALAIRYKRPLQQIQVAIQELDGSGLEAVSFSATDVALAESDFLNLAARITALLVRANSRTAPQTSPRAP